MAFPTIYALVICLLLDHSLSSSRPKRQDGTSLAFEKPSYTYCLPSPVSIGTFVDQLVLNDRSSTATFSIPSNDPNLAINPLNGQLFVSQDLGPGKSITAVVQAAGTSQTATTFVTVQTAPCPDQAPTTTVPPFSMSIYRFTLTSCTAGTYIGSVGPYARSAVPVTYQSTSVPAYIKLYSNGQLYLLGQPTANTVTFPVSTSTGASATVTVTGNCAVAVTSTSTTTTRRTHTWTTTTTTTPTTTTSTTTTTTASTAGGLAAAMQCVPTRDPARFIQFGTYQFFFPSSNCAAGVRMGQMWLDNAVEPVTYSIVAGSDKYRVDSTAAVYSTARLTPGVLEYITISARDATGKTGVGCVYLQGNRNCDNP